MDDEHPEWLPADWKVCVRVRTSGKKDKYYINPSDGLKFNSKPEVCRYLKDAKKDLKLKEPNKANSKQTVAEKLPSGWIKEIKITKKGGKTRRDPYYIDPVSGRHFRSMQEVNRYLESTDSRKVESKEDDPDHTNEELDHPQSSTAVAKKQRSIDEKEDQVLTGNENVKSVGNGSPTETNALEQREKDSLGEDGQQEMVALPEKRKKSKGKWMNDLPRRTSKRLARVEADLPLDIETSKGAREAAGKSNEAQVNTIENINQSENNTSEDFGKQKQEPANGDEAIGNGIDLKEGKKPLDSSLNDILMDPCIEFAIKTLTGAIPIEDVKKVEDISVASLASPNQTSGSSSTLPFGDIWADPCFEFAVKTLTSEIPMEDGSRFQILFEQPLGSSGGGCNSIAK